MTLLLTPDSVWQDSLREEILAWHRAEGMDPKDVFQVSIDTETMRATFYQYARNQAGHHYATADFLEVEQVPPVMKHLSRLPPGGWVIEETHA